MIQTPHGIPLVAQIYPVPEPIIVPEPFVPVPVEPVVPVPVPEPMIVPEPVMPEPVIVPDPVF